VRFPQEEDIEHLGLHAKRCLIGPKNIFAKRKKLGMTFAIIYWLFRCKLKLNGNFSYKNQNSNLWVDGIQLWSIGSISSIEILERFQSKSLRMVVDAPCYVPNMIILMAPNTESLRRNPPLPLSNTALATAYTQTIKQAIAKAPEK
jgi:hypothetical protein